MVSGSAGVTSVGGVVSAGNVVADASIDAEVEPEVDEGLELHAIKLMDNTATAQRDFIRPTVVGASAVALHGAGNSAWLGGGNSVGRCCLEAPHLNDLTAQRPA